MQPLSQQLSLRGTEPSASYRIPFAERISLVCASALFFILVVPGHAAAATLSFSPASGSQAVGDEFSVKVVINPGSDSVNAADGTVSYDPTLLTLESFTKDTSVFSLWTSEPAISKSSGTLQFSGGTPTAFSSSGTVLTLKFKALQAGTATLSYAKGSILAADGKGTDVYQSGSGATFTITDAAPASANAAQNTGYVQTTDAGPPPIAPVINSLAFPDENTWYATSTGDFEWNLPLDATAVRTLLSDSASSTPVAVLKPMASSTVVSGIKDGISYFYVQVQNGSGWGDLAKRKVQIDTQPPLNFNIALEPAANGAVPKLAFKAEDALSGVDHYEILIASSSVVTISASDVTDGTYPVPPQGGGSELVTIRAYDKAGNMTAASSTLDLPKVQDTTAQQQSTTTSPPSGNSWNIDRILTILFAFIIGGLAAWIRFSKKAAEKEQSDMLALISEVSDKNDRVFSAMREEFEQMVNDFDKRPYLTPEERTFLENIKEVLDISEELIDTGMDELKKLARTKNEK